MLDPANELLPPPISPSISSPSSSDLDTESTGSFFHDRSTTLGTLMGVSPTFPSITFRAPSQRGDTAGIPAGNVRKSKKKTKKSVAEQLMRGRRTRWWWWRLCSEQELKPSKLGEFLEVERRFGDGAIFEIDGVIDLGNANHTTNGRMLFADGRVLPPPAVIDDDGTSSAAAGSSLCRFSVPGICS